MPIIVQKDLITREGDSSGLEVRELVDAEQGSQSLKMGELTIAPQSRVPRHIHPNTGRGDDCPGGHPGRPARQGKERRSDPVTRYSRRPAPCMAL